MAASTIEIRRVDAHRVDGAGRVRGVRVVGVADRRDCTILVTLSPREDEGGLFLARHYFGARESAAFVRPEALGLGAPDAALAQGDDGRARTGFMWYVEFDLEAHPQVPPVELGLQKVPLTADAKILHASGGNEDAPTFKVDSLALVAAYPVGVLFVHGIGVQKKSETLSQWTAPLLAWINGWFDAAARNLGKRAEAEELDAWLATLLVRESWASHDADSGDRYRLATDFADRAAAKLYASDREALKAKAGRALAGVALRALEPEEIEAGKRFERHLRSDLGAGIVGGVADLADARLIDGDAPVTMPSSVEMRLTTLAPDGEVERSRWLLAESHWAESFRPPAFGPFGAWCLRVAPVIWVHYFVMIFERSKRSWLRGACALVVLATLVLAMVVAFALLLVLSLIPWPRLRAMVLAAQRSLAGVVGDSYIFLKDVVQRRAIIDRVRRDVEWLSRRCRKIVVVAHSQGAAAADRALNNRREYDPERLHTLVTLGAGVQTLKRLGDLGESTSVLLAGCSALVGGAVFWAGVVGFLLALPAAWCATTVLLGAVILLGAGRAARILHPGVPTLAISAGATKPWHDFFASHDPVPWGPIVATESKAGPYVPHEVSNRRSYVTDHTSYWQNGEEVVAPVARLIAEAAGVTALDRALPDADAALQTLGAARRARVAWLFAARIVALLCTAIVCVAEWGSLAAVAAWSWGAAATRIGVMPDALAAFPGASAIRGSLAILVPYALYATLVAGVWSAWGAGQARKILRSRSRIDAAGWRWLFIAVVAAMVGVTAAIVQSAAR